MFYIRVFYLLKFWLNTFQNFGSGPRWGLLYLVWVGFWTVFIVGTAKYYNFMDGINGITGLKQTHHKGRHE